MNNRKNADMIDRFILSTKKVNMRSAVVWNAVGGAIDAGQSAILLIFVSRCMGIITAGFVTIAYAIANLLLTMSKYGVRNYQVTDVKEKHSFSTYLYSRVVSVVIVFIITIIYLVFCANFCGYSIGKVYVILEITILKLIDAMEDVYLGRYQQCGRFDIGAKIMAVRIAIATFGMCIAVLLTKNIHLAIWIAVVLSITIDSILIYKTFKVTGTEEYTFNVGEIVNLLKICFPLCVGTTLSIYIGNVPKYMIDAYMNEELQAIFGYIMLPVFAIMLFNNFIYQPMIKGLGDLWAANEKIIFKRRVFKQCLIVVGLTIIILFTGLLLGLPILSLLYNIDLSPYKMEFAILLIGGGFFALASYLIVPITTIRKQNYIAGGYLIVAILSLLLGRVLVVEYEMLGAALLYLIVNAILVVTYIIVLIVGINRSNREVD